MTTSKGLDVQCPSDTEKGDSVMLSSKLVKVGVTEEIAKKDKALALLETHHIALDPDSAEAKRILQKIDLRILPLSFAVYTLMLMDKSSISFAGVMGIQKDCNLTGDQFSWLGSLVYFGYLAGEIPSTYIMQRLPLAKVLGWVSIIWGIVVAMHAACESFASLAVLRFILGFFEVYTAPAVIYIIGSWYTREEQVPRLALWYMCYGFGNIFGGFFAWCVYQADTFQWRGLFILYGCMTCTVGVLILWLLAASPTDARWLNEEEKTICLERVRDNKTGTEVWQFKKAQLKESFLDPRFYLIFLLLVSTGLPSGGLTVFGPSIIAGFGFTTSETTLLYLGTGAAACACVGVAGAVAKFSNRTIAGVFTLLVSVLGVVIMLAVPEDHYGGRYAGYVLAIQFPNCIPYVITFMTAGIGGSTKKFAFGAAYQLGYAIGNLIGPQTYRPKDAPTYYPAKYTMLAFLIFCIILLGSIGLLHKHWNSKRDEQDSVDNENGVAHITIENEEFADLTDFRLRSFRYPI